jgi:hypothetical protein
VRSPADRTAGSAENDEYQSDGDQNESDRPQNRYLGDETDQKQNDTEHDHDEPRFAVRTGARDGIECPKLEQPKPCETVDEPVSPVPVLVPPRKANLAVTTSARLQGRAQDGFADHLQQLQVNTAS